MSDTQQPARITPKRISLVRKKYITPHLLRLTLTGDSLEGFPENQNGAHLKLFFPNQASGILELPYLEGDEVFWPEHKPVPRAYTVRRYCARTNELDIDFVVHGTESPASGWAINAAPGAEIGLIGPSGPDPLLVPADWHLLAGDLTALPAICAILEKLPEDARGHVLFELDSLENQHQVQHPEGIQIHWMKSRPHSADSPLAERLNTLAPPTGTKSISAFIAGENASVIACRKVLKQNFNLSRKNMYAIPYWKRGKNEETYHQERHDVTDEDY